MANENETTAAAESESPKKRANSAHTFAWIDGKAVWDYGTLGKVTVDPDKIEVSARHFLLNYGIKQWLQDGAAVSAGSDGKTDPAAKFNGMLERAELLNSGTAASGLLRRGGGSGAFSYVTRALVALGTFAGQDVSTYDKANAYVKSLAESTKPEIVKYGFKGQVGKARAWLEANSKSIAAEIDKIKAAELSDTTPVDADELLEGLVG